ncbi:hypothetical protein HF086_016769, partial [Spodoptera exigua]
DRYRYFYFHLLSFCFVLRAKIMGKEVLHQRYLVSPEYDDCPDQLIGSDSDEDCFLVTSEEGELFFKSPSNDPVVCGIYIIAEPDKRIEVIFNYLDVPCENGGLVAWVDGWELNGQVWPADSWDDDRVVESCDQRPSRKLVSRQNAALVQYRVPARGKGFAVTIRHLKNTKPCNVMLFGAEGVYTLRNHGETGNCSMLAVSPATVHVLDLNVGVTIKKGRVLEMETGTIHHVSSIEV